MSERFDDLTRAVGASPSRRRVLKMFGAAAIGAVGAVVLRPFQGNAVTCPAGSAICGQGCCPKGGSCTDAASSCCCPKGTTPCGPSCCQTGVACVDADRGLCGCPAKTTPCGSGAGLTCCAAGQACSPGCPNASSFGTATACVSGLPCIAPGASCAAGSTCCGAGNSCINNICQSSTCGAFNGSCANDSDCCSGFCTPLGLPTCSGLPPGRTCTNNNQCAGDHPFCVNGVCCLGMASSCTSNSDCCGGICVDLGGPRFCGL